MPFQEQAGGEVAVASAAGFLAQILDDAPQPVWVVDEQGLIVFANPAAVAVLGYDDPAELDRRPSHDSVHYKLRPTRRTSARC
jgi:PAS domain S-box-containing protein